MPGAHLRFSITAVTLIRGHRGYQSATMIAATTLLVSLSVLMSAGGGYASSFDSRQEQEAYLKKYAYMGSSSSDPRLASITDPTEMFKMAVMKFQWMAGINETGVVDDETVKMMKMPRCGMADEVGMAMVTKKRRRRRYAAQGSRWPTTRLTYRINNYTTDLSKDVTDSDINMAFQRWSDVSPLTFTKVTDRTKQVDIDIDFVSGNHGDGNGFDGRGGVLAHAFFPQYGGDAHFDEDEQWTSKSYSGTNLLEVAIHEFGHSLGLSHSDVNKSIMFPFYSGYRPDVRLHSDDIAGIQYIYGSMMRPVQTSRRPSLASRSPLTTPRSRPSSTKRMPPSGHAICRDPTVDAIFAVNEDVYVFKGAEYYMGHRLRFLSPARSISADWRGLPNNIDTAVYLDGSIVFFKGNQCWRYNSSRQSIGRNPQYISTLFSGLPSNISAAFVWSGNGKLYVISGDKYYRMSKRSWFSNNYRVDAGYPQPLRLWKGLPSKIDAAFNYTNSRTYFFSNSSYYRFNDVRFEVDSGYPLSTATHWLGCSDRIVEKWPEDDMMEKEWMAGGDQFMTGGVGLPTNSAIGLPTNSVLLSTIALLASCLLFL